MAEQRVGSRGQRMGSSRRRQLRRDAGEEPPWAAAVMQRVQEVVQEQRGDTEGFVTRADMQVRDGAGGGGGCRVPSNPTTLWLCGLFLEAAGGGYPVQHRGAGAAL